MKTSKLVSHILRFVDLNTNEQAILAKYTTRSNFNKSDFLLTEGDISNTLFFIETGCVRMIFNTTSAEITTQFAIEDWWITDFFSYISKTPSEYSIQALEQSEIISLDKANYDTLIKTIPQLSKYFETIMQRHIAASQARIKCLYAMTSEELLQHFTTSFPEFTKRVPQSMIYSYLGITPKNQHPLPQQVNAKLIS